MPERPATDSTPCDPESRPSSRDAATPTKRHHSTAGRVARNTIANWIGLLVSSVILLLLTPFLERTLGDVRFGIYTTANRTLMFVALLALGLREAVTRFSSREVAAGDTAGLNSVLSTLMLFFAGVGTAGWIVCAVIGANAPSLLVFPREFAFEALVLFLSVGFNFFLGQISTLHDGVLIGHQRYDLSNLAHIARDVTRAVVIVVAVTIGWRTLGGLSVALMSGAVAYFVLLAWLSHRQHPGLSIRPSLARSIAAREVFGFSMWNAIVQIGNVVVFAAPTFVVANTFGAKFSPHYDIPLMLADRIRLVVAGLAATLTPMAAETLVTGDRDRFRRLVFDGTRAAATLTLPTGLILLVLMRSFLVLWMGPDYADSASVFGVLMIAMLGRTSQASTLRVLIGGGNIRGLAVIQGLSAVATVALTVLLTRVTSWGVLAAAWGMAIPLFLSHTVFLPWYISRQMEVPLSRYLVESYRWPVVSALAGLIVALLASRLFPPDTWLIWIAEFATAMVASAAVAWFTCIDASLRERIRARLRKS